MPFNLAVEGDERLYMRGPYKPLPSQAPGATSSGMHTDFPFIPPPDYKEPELHIPPPTRTNFDDSTSDNELPFIPQPDFPAEDSHVMWPRRRTFAEPTLEYTSDSAAGAFHDATTRSPLNPNLHNSTRLTYDPIATASMGHTALPYRQIPDPDAANAWRHLQEATKIEPTHPVPSVRRQPSYHQPLYPYSNADAAGNHFTTDIPSRPSTYRPAGGAYVPSRNATIGGAQDRYRKLEHLFETSSEPPVRVLPQAPHTRQTPVVSSRETFDRATSNRSLLGHLEEHKRSDSLKRGVPKLANCPVCVAATTVDILLGTTTNNQAEGINSINQISEEDEVKRHRQSEYFYQLRASRSVTARVTEDRVGRAKQELTVTKGEYLEILDSSDQWWEASNVSGQVGFVPYNILRIIVWDSVSDWNDELMATRQ